MNYTVAASTTVINIHINESASGPNISVEIGEQNSTQGNSLSINAVPSNRKRKDSNALADSIFKLPFEYGWSREIRHRPLSTNEKTACDVYYYHSSSKIRYRTLKEIQDFLELSTTENTPLTKENFTFKHQAIGISDKSKEFHTSTSKLPLLFDIDSPDPMALRPNENTSKIRIVENTNELNEPSTPKYKKNNLEATPSGSNHLHDVQSSSTSKSVDVVTLSHDEIRNVELISCLVQSSIDTMMALQPVIKYLKVDEMLAVAQVCKIVNGVSTHSTLSQNVCLKDCTIHDWKECIDMLNYCGTLKLNTDGMVIPENIDSLETFWKQFTQEIGRANKLKSIELHKCPTFVINEIIKSLPQLEVLHATSIKDIHLLEPGVKMNSLLKLNFSHLNKMKNLTELKIKGLHNIQLSILPSFSNLINLKTFALTSIKDFPRKMGFSLNTLTTSLEQLEIGDCDNLPSTFGDSIKRLVNLKFLRLENCNANCQPQKKLKSHGVFTSIRDHPNLKVLELVNIKFCNCVEDTLGDCVGLKALLIILAHNNNCQSVNRLTKCLQKLAKTLTHYVCGLTTIQLVHGASQQYQNNENNCDGNLNVSNVSTTKPTLKTSIPIHRFEGSVSNWMIDEHSIPRLNNTLGTLFINTKFKVIKVTLEAATFVYLTDHFDDIM